MVLNAAVNQVDAERLRLGMKATIRLDAYPDVRLPGTLVGIGAMSKTSTFRASYVGEIPVRIKIEDPDARLIPDLTGSAEIVMDRRPIRWSLRVRRSSKKRTALTCSCKVRKAGPSKKVELGLSSFTQAVHPLRTAERGCSRAAAPDVVRRRTGLATRYPQG